MRILITGGCGFIGVNLIKALNSRGEHYIRVLDNLSACGRDNLEDVCQVRELDLSRVTDAGLSPSYAATVDLVLGDIRDASLAIDATKGLDAVVHLAANSGVMPSIEDPRADCLTNVIGTLNYLEAARANRLKAFVFASSGATIGECEPPIHEELAPHPASPYGSSKLAGEAYCSAYFTSYGLRTVALRFSNVYGPYSYHKQSVVAKFIRRAMEGKPLLVYGDGNQTRDFIYVEDLTAAIARALDNSSIGGEVLQIATNKETTIHELVDTLALVLRRNKIELAGLSHERRRPGEVPRSYSSTRKAKKLLGWTCKVSLQAGLTATVRSWLENRHLQNDSDHAPTGSSAPPCR